MSLVWRHGPHTRGCSLFLSENVAQGPDAGNISDQWVKSPAHRQNLLDPDMNVIGVGVAEHDGELFAAEDFAKVKPGAN